MTVAVIRLVNMDKMLVSQHFLNEGYFMKSFGESCIAISSLSVMLYVATNKKRIANCESRYVNSNPDTALL